MTVQRGVTLGVVLPCRDEEAVLERKLANLARARWPAGRHVVVVVDDGSGDRTLGLARALGARLFPLESAAGTVQLRVTPNERSPGKPGAIATGLAVAADESVDLVVLSDADVVVEPGALCALAAAFRSNADLAMACGAQWFVRDLDPGGAFRAADGGELVRADGRYDRWTAWVRRLESRSGRLFSVHGQLLAWRASLGLLATPGLAADDLDLRHQVRARTEPPRRIERIEDAVFAECKEVDRALDAQALRRARAYFQTVSWRRAPELPDRLDRLQLHAYRVGPLAAPWVLAALALGAPALVAVLLGPRAALGALFVLVALLAIPGVRRLVRLMAVIARAQLKERAEPLGDRWKMARR